MNGGADLGGMQGFGPVNEDADEPMYHAPWEPRVMGMVIALGACGQWNIDQSRHARESLPPAEYMASPYYKIWAEGVEKLLLDRTMVTSNELKSGKAEIAPVAVKATLIAEQVWNGLHSLGGRADRVETRKPKFKVGKHVRTINSHPMGHTRLPRYARGREGVITKMLGFHVFPDSSGNNRGEDPQWLYQVRFTSQELWGLDQNPRDSVTLDLWEPHFET